MLRSPWCTDFPSTLMLCTPLIAAMPKVMGLKHREPHSTITHQASLWLGWPHALSWKCLWRVTVSDFGQVAMSPHFISTSVLLIPAAIKLLSVFLKVMFYIFCSIICFIKNLAHLLNCVIFLEDCY